MDEREDVQLRKLNAAYARVRICGDVRRHVEGTLLQEVEALERETLESYEARIRERDTASN